MAVLYTALGRQKFEKYLNDLKYNQVRLVGGNSIVAELVGSGQMLAGLTDVLSGWKEGNASVPPKDPFQERPQR